MKNFVLLSLLFLIGSQLGSAQVNLLNATVPEEIGVKSEAQIKKDNDKPLAYGYIDDRDLLWSKVVWEIIDLGQKINFPLYYPIEDLGTRKSLFSIIKNGIEAGEITEVYEDSYFRRKLSKSDIQEITTSVDTVDAGIDLINQGEQISQDFIDTYEYFPEDVRGYKIKGVWYFDKRDGELKYRLLALCPVVPDFRSTDPENPDLVELYWVWYSSIREKLHEEKVFNTQNAAYPISYDHLMNARIFHGIIYKEENEYGDRSINEYIRNNALLQLLESDHIKETIRNFEEQMWNY